ncbi:2-dehydropantoate 2-reductase [Paenibacillus sp. YPG26]|uniref:ketopantoate reductase family protein n=1 Tax=Paenibacillus sp. YPG26 TaxID=2878915 RepID=UPI00203F8E70|nr:2-dehydropantoate 2-reductase [Paenibacillus sp. YPG26]USB34488.1 2-dehydropantoate 2-reductase [Paenibacillus sp. YPG26]
MKVEIMGAGALGLMFGAALVAAGEDVRIWTRTAEQAEALGRDGIRLIMSEGQEVFAPAGRFLVESSRELDCQKIDRTNADWILVTTKQRHMDERLHRHLAVLRGEGTDIICFQNGVGHIERLSEALGGQHILAALTTEGARKEGDCTVYRSGEGQTRLGLTGIHEKAGLWLDKAENLAVSLTMAGFPAVLSNDIDKEIYRKLLINAAINPLTALLRIRNGELLASEERRALLIELIEETLDIYNHYGISYDADIKDQVFAVCRSTAHNMSSMLKDVLAGQVTEVNSINGQLVKMAHKKEIKVPAHERVWRLVSAMLAHPDGNSKL